ncbi:MAG: tRNA pseudouridine(38-40) synthase TruA [Ferruginibacter sp.]|nr:tRNA pseudouridine(38-40) synthase TruA [Ferruginibacter sp.]
MPRYFLEVSYKGDRYAGFQVQKNANTVQAEVEKALQVYFREPFILTGSSRTDTGVHALQNYFHFDFDSKKLHDWNKATYRLNAILPNDIVVKSIRVVQDKAHCRFDAKSRTYEYSIYQSKDPFLADRCYYYPYTLDLGLLNEAAGILMSYHDFGAFSKKNTQVKSHECILFESEWVLQGSRLIYRVSGNRFLRGMVRGLTGTMLKVGRKKTSIASFVNIIESRDPSLVDFSVDPHGLMLVGVTY